MSGLRTCACAFVRLCLSGSVAGGGVVLGSAWVSVVVAA